MVEAQDQGGQPGPVTERLWLTEPRRRTALVNVVAVRGDAFALDRSLFCPRSRAYRHVQRPDRGVVWLPGGEKRRLVSVFEDAGTLWHRVRGTVPERGVRLNMHLDVVRREETERTHTAMHLALCALAADNAPALLADPEVKGGGSFRLVLDAPSIPRTRLAGWVAQVNAWTAADLPVRREPVPRDVATHRFVGQGFVDEPIPGPATTLEGIFVDGVGGLPCDGTHAGRTGQIGAVALRHAHPGRDGGFVLGWMLQQS